ncbi:MAG: polysaccharide biosynthesis C-terminal domain-containing protein [Clostridia bacterium]|nr:polysaccharide biosynthesis C-terminal domain-containing protein [Clostridia bacterium]
MSRIKYLLKNTLIFALGMIGTKIINFILVPLYTNALLPHEYGIADLVFTLGTVIIPILILNVNEAILRFSLDKHCEQNKIMSIGIISILIMIIIATCLYPLLKLYPPFAEYSVNIFIYIISSGCCTVFMYNLRGKELLVRFSIGNIINAIMVASMNILFLVVLNFGLKGYFLAYTIANVVTMLFAFFAGNVISALRNFSIDKKLMGEMLKYALVLIPNSFMWWIMDSSDRVMLTAFSGVAITGIYAISGKLPSLVSVISSIFNQAWNYSAIKENESSDKLEYINNVFDYLVIIVIAVASVILLVLKPFMSVYVEASYYDAWKYTPPLIVGTVILVLSTFLSSSYTVNKDSKGFLFSALTGAAINIILNFALIPIIGAFGAAIATCIAYASVFLYRYFDTKKYLKLKIFTVRHILEFTCLIVATIATYLGFVGYFIIAIELIALIIISRKQLQAMLSLVKGVFKKKQK